MRGRPITPTSLGGTGRLLLKAHYKRGRPKRLYRGVWWPVIFYDTAVTVFKEESSSRTALLDCTECVRANSIVMNNEAIQEKLFTSMKQTSVQGADVSGRVYLVF